RVGYTRSTGRQTKGLHDRRPLVDVAIDHIGEVLRRAAQWLIAELGERGSEFRRFQTRVDLDIELVDHVARRVRRRQQPGPTRRDEAGEAALGHGRQVRQLRDALGASRGERAKFAALDQRVVCAWVSTSIWIGSLCVLFLFTPVRTCRPVCLSVYWTKLV